MRLFELLLLLSNLGLFALTVGLKKGRRRSPVFALSGVATLILIIHGTVEGYRIQLFFLYGITIIYLVLSSYSYFKKWLLKNPPVHVGLGLYRYSDHADRNRRAHVRFSCISTP
ncbi:hypothetical protein M0651_05680 [Paenibacillus sp. MBLB2552]|uniref:Uncharacterized protein n=1 Tax=Paenibacillus mellifer TaxID=2937794 RepID=A0A9X2BP21_9BACL|nr:hypothetical protein [Paenibacillus mellifer]